MNYCSFVDERYGKTFGETIQGLREMNLQEKLFRLKSMKGLQDTEENHDDSELKVGFKKNTLTVTIIQSFI